MSEFSASGHVLSGYCYRETVPTMYQPRMREALFPECKFRIEAIMEILYPPIVEESAEMRLI